MLADSATWAAWVGAIATAAAVVVALSGYWLATRRANARRPVLTLRDDSYNSHQEVMIVPGTGLPAGKAYWVRLAVSNESGRDAAVEAQVLLQEVQRLDVASSAALDLVMVGSPPLGWTNLDSPEATVAGAVARLLDLGFLSARGGESLFTLALKSPPPNDQRHILEPGQYQLRLAVTARNADARFYNVLLRFDDGWRQDAPMDHHLSVEVRG